MKKYNVRVYLSTFFDTEVEAENEQQARELAEDSENWNMEEIENNLNVQPCETEAKRTRKVNVVWDTDGEDIPELPIEVYVPVSVDENDIADWLSDKYGFCVSSLQIEETKDEEPQPLFSDEDIESLHVGDNILAIGFMHVENEADLVKAKDYLRELNRRHGEPLRGPSKREALAKLADVVRKYGEDEGGNIKLNTWEACGDGWAELNKSTIDEIRLFDDDTMEICFNVNTNDCLPAEDDQFKADDISKFADDLIKYFENEKEEENENENE